MTFKEFHLAQMRDPVLGKLLPMQCRKTYPRLMLDGETLCAGFVGFLLKPAAGGALVFPPAYFLNITYPNCAVRAFVKRAPSGEAHPMTPQTPETIRALSMLCDQALREFDEKSEHLTETLDTYNALLDKVLEPEQRALLDQMAAQSEA